jgi:nucleoid-associated protein YgaU
MDKYLLQILLETKTIIIPGLGALTITNEDTGEIMFMSYLKYDDGALVKHIVAKDGFTENEARNLIAKYVSEINDRLAQGNDYEMFQFGKFYIKDGEIEFDNWKGTTNQKAADINEKTEESIPEDVKIIETPVELIIPLESPIIAETEIIDEPEFLSPSDVSDEDSKQEKSLDEILNETAEEEEEKEEPDVEKEYKITEDLEIEEIEISTENSYTPPVQEAVIMEEIIEVPEVEKEESPAEAEAIIEFEKSAGPEVIVVKKKRKPVFWILLVLIFLLLGLGSLTILYYDQVKKYLPFMESQRTEIARKKANAEDISENLNESAEAFENASIASDSISDGTEIEEPVVQKPIEEVKAEPIVPIEETPREIKILKPRGKDYFVIGGAFEEKNNADRYVNKLIVAGNKSSIIGKYDGLYLVAIESFESDSDAQQAVSKFSEITSKAWVFHQR